eukprot:5086985-Pleurochrysis_carterae.AAC.1
MSSRSETTEENEEEGLHRNIGVNRLQMLSERTGISEKTLFVIYEEQKSLCAITGLAMEDTVSDTWYSIDCAKKVTHRPLSADNVHLVCSIINSMKPENMQWEAFQQFCSHISDKEFDESI